MPDFRLQSRYVLLTYSQCGDLDPWLVHDTIVSVPAECIIGRENHADGGVHLHAFVDFGRRVDIRDPRRFDVEGYHPNIQPCGRTPQKMCDYAIKDGDVVAGGLNPILNDSIQRTDSVWDRIANAETPDEFWQLARQLAPRALLCNFNSLRAFAEWHYRPPAATYEHPGDLRIDTSGSAGFLESKPPLIQKCHNISRCAAIINLTSFATRSRTLSGNTLYFLCFIVL